MTGDLRERLRRLDPAPTGARPPSHALDADEVLARIERRLSMADETTTRNTTIDVHLDEGVHSRPVREGRDRRERIRLALVGVAAAILFGVISAGAASLLGNTRTFGAAADPQETIEAYVEAYNAGDIDGVMALFDELSVIRGHPYGDVTQRLDDIRVLQTRDMDSAGAKGYVILNVEVDGTIVEWDHIFQNSLGELWCATGNVAEVVDGTIVEWRFAPNRYICP